MSRAGYTSKVPRSGQPWDGDFLWRSPLFDVFESLVRRWAGAPGWPALAEYTDLAEQQRRARAPDLRPLVFAPARRKSRRWRRRSQVELSELYDGSIELHGQVPCLTESYHDLWNAVVFAAFPRAKRALHHRQYRALTSWVEPGAMQLPSRRTREQDALTVFDEGGSVILLDPEGQRRWQDVSPGQEPGRRLELSRMPPNSVARAVFGHALLELAQYQLPAIRSSAVVLPVSRLPHGPQLFETIDLALAGRLGNPAAFRAPGADAVLEFDRAGRAWLGPSSPAPPEPLARRRQVNAGGETTESREPAG